MTSLWECTCAAEITKAAYELESYKQIMGVIARRLQDQGEDWRHVYKSLLLLEYMAKHGPQKVLHPFCWNCCQPASYLQRSVQILHLRTVFACARPPGALCMVTGCNMCGACTGGGGAGVQCDSHREADLLRPQGAPCLHAPPSRAAAHVGRDGVLSEGDGRLYAYCMHRTQTARTGA